MGTGPPAQQLRTWEIRNGRRKSSCCCLRCPPLPPTRDEPPPPITELSIDTLADGSVLISNPLHGLWDANPDARWRLVEDLRTGSAVAEEPDAFGNVVSFTLDGLGRLWIGDSQAKDVREMPLPTSRSGIHRALDRQIARLLNCLFPANRLFHNVELRSPANYIPSAPSMHLPTDSAIPSGAVSSYQWYASWPIVPTRWGKFKTGRPNCSLSSGASGSN